MQTRLLHRKCLTIHGLMLQLGLGMRYLWTSTNRKEMHSSAATVLKNPKALRHIRWLQTLLTLGVKLVILPAGMQRNLTMPTSSSTYSTRSNLYIATVQYGLWLILPLIRFVNSKTAKETIFGGRALQKTHQIHC